INENRLVELKGFGAKTQEDLRQKLEFHQRSRGQFLYRTLDAVATPLLEALEIAFPDVRFARTGALRRCCPTLTSVAVLTTLAPAAAPTIPGLENVQTTDDKTTATWDGFPLTFHHCTPANWGSKQFRHTGAPEFLRAFVAEFTDTDFTDMATEAEVFARVALPYLEPELREDGRWLPHARNGQLPKLIEEADIRGVVHSHSTYSDGIHSLRQMAEGARDRGYAYLVISDHSQTAVYAGGLKPEQVREQWAEIDALN
ncbi:MAG: DNA polymerase/3'-5' exonuclease PolX, partial [Bacteroidota bacterium]